MLWFFVLCSIPHLWFESWMTIQSLYHFLTYHLWHDSLRTFYLSTYLFPFAWYLLLSLVYLGVNLALLCFHADRLCVVVLLTICFIATLCEQCKASLNGELPESTHFSHRGRMFWILKWQRWTMFILSICSHAFVLLHFISLVCFLIMCNFITFPKEKNKIFSYSLTHSLNTRLLTDDVLGYSTSHPHQAIL